MPGVDILGQLGASEWIVTDGARLQHAMQRARFDLLGVASRHALAGDLHDGNAEVKAVLDQNPAMRGWCVVNPTYPERSSEEMRRYLGSPKWLGAMLDPRKSGQRLNSATTREVLNAYRRYTKPILVHVPDEETLLDLEEIAPEFNTIKFIAQGAGGDAWQDCAITAKRFVNIFLEPFSGGSHRGKVELLVQLLGHHRILFGSSYPDHNPGAALGLLHDAKISSAEKESILTHNAAKLFGLTRRAAPEE